MKVHQMKNKFYIIGPGFQVMIEETMPIMEDDTTPLQRVIAKYKDLMDSGKTFEIEGAEGTGIILFKYAPGQHLGIMTEQQFNNMRREQQFAAAHQPVRPIRG